MPSHIRHLAICLLAALSAVSWGADVHPKDRETIIAAYLDWVNLSDSLSAAQKISVARIIETAEDADRQEVITQSLTALYPDFAAAANNLAAEKILPAMDRFHELGKSDDPYLSAHAVYFRARALVMLEQYEQAAPLLQQIVAADPQRTLYRGEALFMLGVAQAELLHRADARSSLNEFVNNYPGASQRMLIGAQSRIDAMAGVQDGTLSDVGSRMDYSRRKLALADTGDETQAQQQHIIDMLDKLIEQAEQQEQAAAAAAANASGAQGSAQGQGPASGNTQPTAPATQSIAPVGQARQGPLHQLPNAADDWGKAPQHEREEILNAIKARYPQRYQQLVEQYYRSLSQDEVAPRREDQP